MRIQEHRGGFAARSATSVPPGTRPRRCRTVVLDYFRPKRSGAETHGVMVTNVAEQLGADGNTISQQLSTEFGNAIYRGRGDFVSKMINTEGLSSEEAFEAIDTFTQQRAVGFYEATGAEIEVGIASELENSTINASFGFAKSEMAENLYGEASFAWRMQDRPEYKTLLENYASAYNLDSSKLLHDDPEVHQPERQRLQQAIINHVSDVVDHDPEVAEARGDFRQVLREFEMGHNSFVVAAGNDAATDTNLSRRNGGLPLDLPEDFETNLLAVPEATTVGATKMVRGRLGFAGYGSRGPAVDVFADGDYQSPDPERAGANGTSFASPRVSETMRQLHCDNPDMTSSQVESLMLNSLTSPHTEDGVTVQVLDTE